MHPIKTQLNSRLLIPRLLAAWMVAGLVPYHQAGDTQWKVHDNTRPNPVAVDPGTVSTQETPGIPPSDAVILFNGHDLSQWRSMDGEPAGWIVKNGVMESVAGSGYIRTLRSFGDCQLHIEWASPTPAKGIGQDRGNSGVFLMGEYEIQVLDCWENRTYADGQAAAVYGQYPPEVNVSKPPGTWQSYDIIFTAPKFSKTHELMRPAYVTVLHNGVLVQNHVELKGPTNWCSDPQYDYHPEKLPLALQDHGNPVLYRNIWIRELPAPGPGEPMPRPELRLSSRVIDRYTGRYEFENDATVLLFFRNQGTLFVQIGEEPGRQYPLYAETENHFFGKLVDIEFTFHTKDNGEVTGLLFKIGDGTRSGHKVW